MTVLNTLRIADDMPKPELVLLHGWGANSAVWQPVLETLAQQFHITCIDLPGHGGSLFSETSQHSVEAWANAALEVAPAKATWLGWSLGGLVAQCAASQAGERIDKLILVGSTCKFVASDDWLVGMDETTFTAFHEEVSRDPRGSLLRFIALQTRGSETASQDARVLRKTLLSPEPVAAAMDAGMVILMTADLRTAAKRIHCPVLLLGGDRDTLIPVSALPLMQQYFKNVDAHIIEQAGHAPFLSHPQQFCEQVSSFVHDVPGVMHG